MRSAGGLLCSNGLGMLVAQAKAAAERFLGRAIPDSRVEEITRQMERQTQNLLLIGMPGCRQDHSGPAPGGGLGLAPGRRQTSRWRQAVWLLHSGPLCPGGRGGLPGPGASGPVPAVQAVRTDHRLWRRHCHPPGELGPHAPEFHGDLSPPGSGPAPHQVDAPYLRPPPVEELYHRRALLYEKLADLTVDNHGTPKETAEEIIRRLAL